MVVKLVGIWEEGYQYPLVEQWLWDYPCIEYNVDEWIMTPISGIEGNMTEYQIVDNAIDANPDLTVVYVDENGTQELHDFIHPENVLYVFGRTSQNNFNPSAKSVRIATPTNKGRLFAPQAACIILDHRYRNGNNSNGSTSNSK